MKLNFYQIDAFTDSTFGGNQACVVPLEEWLSDEMLILAPIKLQEKPENLHSQAFAFL
ncbi:hypothetical protein D3C86_2084510 [compost metagenome]